MKLAFYCSGAFSISTAIEGVFCKNCHRFNSEKFAFAATIPLPKSAFAKSKLALFSTICFES